MVLIRKNTTNSPIARSFRVSLDLNSGIFELNSMCENLQFIGEIFKLFFLLKWNSNINLHKNDDCKTLNRTLICTAMRNIPTVTPKRCWAHSSEKNTKNSLRACKKMFLPKINNSNILSVSHSCPPFLHSTPTHVHITYEYNHLQTWKKSIIDRLLKNINFAPTENKFPTHLKIKLHALKQTTWAGAENTRTPVASELTVWGAIDGHAPCVCFTFTT